MDLLHVVNQASEALKMALEKPNRNRRKGGGKKTTVATTVTSNASKSSSGDGRISKGKSLQRTFVCQQKVLEALFNPKVLHPTADDEQEQSQIEGTKSTLSSLRARRLPASFFKGPSSQPGNNHEMASCRQTNIELPNLQASYGSCLPEFNTIAFPKQQHVPCTSPYHQSTACPTAYPNEQILRHHHHHQHHQALQSPYEVQNEVWTGEHCPGYPEITHPNHHHHNQDFYSRRPCANGCHMLRSQYDSSWDFHSTSTANYGTYASPVIESPTSVDSRGYASTLDDYSPSPDTCFTTDSSVFITNDLSGKMVENTNQLDVCCVDDFYGIAHSFPSTSHQQGSMDQETIDMAPRDSTGSSDLQTTASFSNTSSPSIVNEASPLPEFSHAFGSLCT